MTIDKIMAYLFGAVFCTVLLVVAVLIPDPTPTSMFIFRVVLSIAAGGIGAVIPGLLQVDIPYVRAGGALALTVVVYFFNPPHLLQ
jgi:hypothetical protein